MQTGARAGQGHVEIGRGHADVQRPALQDTHIVACQVVYLQGPVAVRALVIEGRQAPATLIRAEAAGKRRHAGGDVHQRLVIQGQVGEVAATAANAGEQGHGSSSRRDQVNPDVLIGRGLDVQVDVDVADHARHVFDGDGRADRRGAEVQTPGVQGAGVRARLVTHLQRPVAVGIRRGQAVQRAEVVAARATRGAEAAAVGARPRIDGVLGVVVEGGLDAGAAIAEAVGQDHGGAVRRYQGQGQAADIRVIEVDIDIDVGDRVLQAAHGDDGLDRRRGGHLQRPFTQGADPAALVISQAQGPVTVRVLAIETGAQRRQAEAADEGRAGGVDVCRGGGVEVGVDEILANAADAVEQGHHRAIGRDQFTLEVAVARVLDGEAHVDIDDVAVDVGDGLRGIQDTLVARRDLGTFQDQ